MGNDPLVERAQQGDAEALDELFRREWRPIFGMAYSALNDRNDAQDVTQEAFLRALRRLDRYQHRGVPFHAYLATIARNLIRDRGDRPFRQAFPSMTSSSSGPKPRIPRRLPETSRSIFAAYCPNFLTTIKP